jgi:hypothetical protein
MLSEMGWSVVAFPRHSAWCAARRSGSNAMWGSRPPLALTLVNQTAAAATGVASGGRGGLLLSRSNSSLLNLPTLPIVS